MAKSFPKKAVTQTGVNVAFLWIIFSTRCSLVTIYSSGMVCVSLTQINYSIHVHGNEGTYRCLVVFCLLNGFTDKKETIENHWTYPLKWSIKLFFNVFIISVHVLL